jgi:DNA-directed RNA polymerase specialized sigma24 family protein
MMGVVTVLLPFRGAQAMADTPPFEDILQQALQGLDNEDVRLFYEYFEDLKRKAARGLTGKARVMPGASAVAASALLSLLCDLAALKIPLNDVDDQGRPAVWPLILKYVERHCDKWNKWHEAKMRKGVELSLRGATDGSRTIDPEDYRAPAGDEEAFAAALERLCERLSEEERRVLEARLAGKSLAEIALLIGRSENTVSNRLASIREILQTL